MKIGNYDKIITKIKSTENMPDEESIDILVDCVKKCISFSSVKAVKRLEKINHPKLIDTLIGLYNWLEDDPKKRDLSCDVRTAIIEAFGNLNSPKTINTVKKAAKTIQVMKRATLEDMALGLRATAALTLAKIDETSLYEISLLLFDEKPDVPTVNEIYAKATIRKAAAQAIGILGDPTGANLLALKLKFPRNEIDDVLAECLESIIFMKPNFLMDVIEPYLFSRDEYFATITALALAEHFREDILDLLLCTLEKSHEKIQKIMVTAITLTRCNKAKQILENLLTHPSKIVRDEAEEGLKSYPPVKSS